MKDELMHKLKEVEKEREVLAKEKRKIAAEKNEILKCFEVAVKKLSSDDIDAITSSLTKLKLS